jgi:uncharacterized protein (DUF58 family)
MRDRTTYPQRALGVVVAGVGLILSAFAFAAAPLLVPGVAFALLGLAAPAWVWLATRGVRLERRVAADRVEEGAPLETTINVHAGPLGLTRGEVHDQLAGVPVPIGGGRSASVRVVARFERRGIQRLAPPTLSVCDPLHLTRAVCTTRASAVEVLVLPRIEELRWIDGDGGGARALSAAARARTEVFAAVDVDGLRPYQPGTPASRIHWSALARGAGLLERRLQPDGDHRPLVVLDPRGNGPAEHLDAAVRAAASLVFELARMGGCGLLLGGERRPTTVEPDLIAWPAVHARLALVEGGPGARAPALGGGRAAAGPVFYVAVQPLERPPAAPAGGVLVLPAAVARPSGVRPSFTVAGCYGFTFGARARHRSGAGPLRQRVA